MSMNIVILLLNVVFLVGEKASMSKVCPECGKVVNNLRKHICRDRCYMKDMSKPKTKKIGKR